MDDFEFKQSLDNIASALQDTLHTFTKNINWEVKALVEGRDIKFRFHAVCHLSQPELHFLHQDDVELYKDPAETINRICILAAYVNTRVQYAFMSQLFGKPFVAEEFEHDFTDNL